MKDPVLAGIDSAAQAGLCKYLLEEDTKGQTINPKKNTFYRASQVKIKQVVEEMMPGLVYFN